MVDTNILVIIVLVVIIIIFLLKDISKNKQKDIYELKSLINQDLLNFQNLMERSIKEDFNRLNESTNNRLSQIENSVNKSLITSFDKTERVMMEFRDRVIRIDEAQKSLNDLSKEISSLQGLLNDKKTRGIYGEIELYSLLESAFGANDKRFLKQYKLSNGAIADAVVLASEPLGKIVVDSKFPLENYNRMFKEGISKNDKEIYAKAFKNDVIKHINTIASKYLIKGETAEVAYMFIPAEAVFAQIYGHFSEVINYSYEKRVYLVSPTTLMAYLTAIKAIYLGQKRDEKVLEIQSEFNKLAEEFNRYIIRFNKVLNDFNKTYDDLKDVSITSNKIIKKFNDIDKVNLETNKELENENREDRN